jgi:hypothetical protein
LSGLDDKQGFFLAAPRVTDSLIFKPRQIHEGISLLAENASAVDGTYPTRLGFRAGALSACFMLVYAAATELDVDPEEFEVLEPRILGGNSHDRRPLLQICDFHVNGAGFCDRLAAGPKNQPLAVELMRRIASRVNDAPLKDLLSQEHSDCCDQACYGCLCRFGNQPYHGLLDWRLGLDVLHIMLEPSFPVALDGDYSSPGLRDWRELARRYADDVKSLQSSATSEVVEDLQLVKISPDSWMAIVHPFWDWDWLLENRPALRTFAARQRVVPATTFELSRRLVSTLERCRSSEA